MTRVKVPLTVAMRKKWKKFGDCAKDKEGVLLSTSLHYIFFIVSQEELL